MAKNRDTAALKSKEKLDLAIQDPDLGRYIDFTLGEEDEAGYLVLIPKNQRDDSSNPNSNKESVGRSLMQIVRWIQNNRADLGEFSVVAKSRLDNPLDGDPAFFGYMYGTIASPQGYVTIFPTPGPGENTRQLAIIVGHGKINNQLLAEAVIGNAEQRRRSRQDSLSKDAGNIAMQSLSD